MKILLTTIILLVIACGTSFTQEQEYYVYVRCENQYEGKEGELSQKGDIVEIRPVRSDTIPNEGAKGTWAIIIVKGLDKAIIDELEAPETYVEGALIKTIAYRRNKIDIDALGIKKGLDSKVLDYKTIIKPKVSVKTTEDLEAWNVEKIAYDAAKEGN